MKKIIIVILLITGCGLFQNRIVEQSSIINVPLMSQTEVFQKSLQWIKDSSVSDRNMVEYKDQISGTIVSKGNVYLGDMGGKTISVTETIRIICADNRAIIKITPTSCLVDIYPRPCAYRYIGGLISEINSTTLNLVDEYGKYMKGGHM